jgi:UDP-glucose 4-epimerase
MANILVTGASGFVGRALCKRLMAGEYGLIAASRSGTDWPEAKNVRIELEQPATFSAALQDVEVVIHLAARAHQIADTAVDPLHEFRKINRDAAIVLAERAVQAGARRFVYVSSIGVNGNETVLGKPFTEEDEPQPHDLYAVSKHEAEIGLRQLAARTGLEVVVVRPPLVYGPGAPGNFARLLKLVKTGMPLPLGAIRNLRSFIYVENLADVLATCATHERAMNQTFVVSDGEDISTPGLIREIAARLPKKVYLMPVSPAVMRSGLSLIGKQAIFDKLAGSLQVDSEKVRRELSWQPLASLREGLSATLLPFR